MLCKLEVCLELARLRSGTICEVARFAKRYGSTVALMQGLSARMQWRCSELAGGSSVMNAGTVLIRSPFRMELKTKASFCCSIFEWPGKKGASLLAADS